MRQVVIYGIALVVVGAAAYEFLVARPQFHKVWSELDQLALDGKAMNMTVQEIEQVLGQEPASTFDDDFYNVHVRTYQWPSGLIVRPHTIHVVFVNSTVRNKEGDNSPRRHYFSSVANSTVSPKNYPLLRETIMTNLNLTGLAAGGPGGGGGGGEGGGDGEDKSRDGDDGDKKSGDDPTDTKDPAAGGDAADKTEEGSGDDSAKEDDDNPADDSKDDPAKDDGAGKDKDDGEPGSGDPADGEKPAEEEKKDGDGEPAPGDGGEKDG